MTFVDSDAPPIDIVEVEPRLIALVRRTVPFADMPRAQRDARALLDAALRTAEGEPGGRTLTVWRMPQPGMIDYAPGVFVADGFSASGAVSLFTLPRGRAAHLRMRGSNAGLPNAWGRLFAGVGTLGQVTAGLNWEVYAASGVPPDEAETDLYALLLSEG